MSSTESKPSWPRTYSSSQKESALRKAEFRRKKKYGQLKQRREVAPEQVKLDLQKKLAAKRQFFDSADYFRAAQSACKKEEEIRQDPKAIFIFERDSEGHLVHKAPEVLDFSGAKLAAVIEKSHRRFYDSADHSLALHGLLEYPLGERSPFMLYFQDNHVGAIPHPSSKITPEKLAAVVSSATSELQHKYGQKLPTNSEVLRLKIKPGKGKQHFDSADWALEIASQLPSPQSSPLQKKSK